MAPSSIFLGETEMENRYFCHFRQTAAIGLDGVWGWYLWNQLMLQNSHQEPFARHSMVAIGALIKYHEAAYSAGVNPRAVIMPEIAKLHRDFAMVKYDKAVRLMQRAICRGTTNPRQALLGCILIVCFEMLMGNLGLAIKHAQSGTTILQQWRAQTLLLKKEPPTLLSPAPLTVEDEIVEAYQNLGIQIKTFRNDNSASCPGGMMNDDCITTAALPTSFGPPSLPNLRAAQVYLNLTIRRIYHFMSIALASPPSESMVLAKEFDGEPPDHISVITSMIIHSTSFQVTDAIRTQQQRLATEIADWMCTFAPLFETLCTKKEDYGASFSCIYNVASMMQMQAIATTILTAGIVITNEMDYDRYNPRFRELVDIATAIVKLRKRRKDHAWAGGFWIDIGITPQLFVVVTRCRDPSIRRQAIRLLEDWYIEGSWDPKLVAQIGLFMMEVEEEGLADVDCGPGNTGVIPEKARAVLSQISEDPRRGRALMQCVLKRGGVDGSPVWREKYVEW
jgi:hypothetical protein